MKTSHFSSRVLYSTKMSCKDPLVPVQDMRIDIKNLDSRSGAMHRSSFHFNTENKIYPVE